MGPANVARPSGRFTGRVAPYTRSRSIRVLFGHTPSSRIWCHFIRVLFGHTPSSRI